MEKLHKQMQEISSQIREQKDLEKMFLELCTTLMNEYEIVAGSTIYRVVECEIYYHAPKHPDIYTHGYDEQLETAKWYFNGFGLDLTFGNKELEIHAGILLRGIKRLTSPPEYFNGPSILLREIFSQLGSIFSKDNTLYIRKNTIEYSKESMLIARGKRIGLNEKREEHIANDKDKFCNKNYRFIADVLENKGLSNKISAIIYLFEEEKITQERVKEILNYLPKECK